MRTGYIRGETVAGQQFDAATPLLEMRDSVGLKQYLDVGMLSRFCRRNGMCKPMLAGLDLAELQLRNSRVVDLPFQRRGLHRINIESTAKFRQRVGPALDLLLRCQSGGAKRTDAIGHYPIQPLIRDQNVTASRKRRWVTMKRLLPQIIAVVGA